MVRSNTRSSQRRVLTRSKSPAAPSATASAAGSASADDPAAKQRGGGRRGTAKRRGGGAGPGKAEEDDDVSTTSASDKNSDEEEDDEDEDINNDEDGGDDETMDDELEVSGRSSATATRRSTRAARGRGSAAVAAGAKKPPPPVRRKAQPAKHVTAAAAGRRRAAQDNKVAGVVAARRSARGRRGKAGGREEEQSAADAAASDDDDDAGDEVAGSNDDEREKMSPTKAKKEGGESDDDVAGDDDDDGGGNDADGDEKSKIEPKTTQATSRRGRRSKTSKDPPKKSVDAAEVIVVDDEDEKDDAGVEPQANDEKQVANNDEGDAGADLQENDEEQVAGDESDARADPHEKKDDKQVASAEGGDAEADLHDNDEKQVGRDDEGDAATDPQKEDEKPVESDVERVETNDGKQENEEQDPDYDDYDEARAGTKRKLAAIPEPSSKRKKENSEEVSLDKGDEGVVAHSDDTSVNAHRPEVNEPSTDDRMSPEASGDELQDESQAMDSAKREEKAGLVAGPPDVLTVEAMDLDTSGVAVPLTKAAPVSAGEIASGGAEEEVGPLSEAVDAKPAPAEEGIATAGDKAKSSLESKIPRKAARRSSSSPTFLEPANSSDRRERNDATATKEPVLEAQIADQSSKVDINDLGSQRGESTDVVRRSQATIEGEVKDDPVADPETKALGSSSVSVIDIDQPGRVVSVETDPQSPKASPIADVGSSTADVRESGPSEGLAENDEAIVRSPDSQISLERVTVRSESIIPTDSHTHGHDVSASTIEMENDESQDAPIGAPCSVHPETDNSGQNEAAEEDPPEFEVVASLPSPSIGLGAGDKVEGAAVGRGEEPSDKDSLSEREHQAMQPAVKDTGDVEMADSVDEANVSAADAMDVSASHFESSSQLVAESAVATPSAISNFDDGTNETCTENVDAPQTQDLPQIQSAASLTSAASNTGLGEASRLRITSPSNSDVATDSLHESFATLNGRPVPAFRVSKPTRVQMSPKPEPKKISLERVRLALFSLGCEVHGRRGFERVFSQYWSSFSIVLHGAGLLASTLRQHRAIVDSFLKTRKLRKLHNKLVIGLLDLFYASSPKSQEDGGYSNREVDGKKLMSEASRAHSLEASERVSDLSGGPNKTLQCDLRTHPAPPFSTFVTDPNSTNMINRSYPAASSFSIPGAMAIDPYVRDVATAAGMRVAENAIWLLVAAMKEFAQTALRNCVQLKIAVKSGELPPTPLIRQRVVHRKRDIGNHISENDAMSSSTDSASKSCITALDVFSLTASMSIGGAKSIAGTISRPAFEKALLASYAGSIEPHPDGFDALKDFVAAKISPSLAAKVNYDGSAPTQPADSSGVVTSSTVPRASSKPSSNPRPIQGGGGLGRGAKDLGALRARSITQRSAAAAVAPSVASAVTVKDTPAPPTSHWKMDRNAEQDLTRAPSSVAEIVRPGSAAQGDPPPPQSLESVRNVSRPPSTGLQQERRPSPEPRPQSVNLARRGKGFGVKNLAAMRARSITKPTDAEEGKALTDTPAVTAPELTVTSSNSGGAASIPAGTNPPPSMGPTPLSDDTRRPLDDANGVPLPSSNDAVPTQTTDDTQSRIEAEVPAPSVAIVPSTVEAPSPSTADDARTPSTSELPVPSKEDVPAPSTPDEAPAGPSTSDASIPSTDVAPLPSTEREIPAQNVDKVPSTLSDKGPDDVRPSVADGPPPNA